MVSPGVKDEDMFPAGHLLHDSYRIERIIGRGGMASVFEVAHVRLPRRFALKVITAPTAQSSEFILRFRREAEILASIEHPNLVNVLDWNTTPGGQPYLVMELLTGEDLSQLLQRKGALPLKVALSIFAQAAAALEVVHGYGITHRDLKPANLFLCKNGIVPYYTKVLDFGIAKSSQHSSMLVTDHLVLMGTPAYMSPEQARGDLSLVDARSDQFSLALVLYEMLLGKPAFYRPGEMAMNTLCRILMDDPAPLPDAAMNQVVMRALRKQPEDRYPTLSDMVAAVMAASAVPIEHIDVPETTERITARKSGARRSGAEGNPDGKTPVTAGHIAEPEGSVIVSPEASVYDAPSRIEPPSLTPPSLNSQRSGELLRIPQRKRALFPAAFFGAGGLVLMLVLLIVLHGKKPPQPGDVEQKQNPNLAVSATADLAAQAENRTRTLDMAAEMPVDLVSTPEPPKVHPQRSRWRLELRLSGLPDKSRGALLVQRCIRDALSQGELRKLTRTPIELGLGVDHYMHVASPRLSGERSLQIEQCLIGLSEITSPIPQHLVVSVLEERVQ